MGFYCETILDKFLPIKLKQGLKKNNTMGKNLSIVTLSLLLLLASTGNALNVFDVRTYGAHPNADITQALLNAWKDACAAAGSSRVVVPAGIYKLGVVSFKGPCKGPIELQVQGTIQAPGDPGYFKGSDGWIRFQYIDQFTLSEYKARLHHKFNSPRH